MRRRVIDQEELKEQIALLERLQVDMCREDFEMMQTIIDLLSQYRTEE